MEEEDNKIPVRTPHVDPDMLIPVRDPSKNKAPQTELQKTFSNSGGIVRGFGTGYGNSDYDKSLNWDAEIGNNVQADLNEHRGQVQPTLDRLGNALGNFGVKTAGFLTTTVGQLGAVLPALATWDASKIWDNPVAKAGEDMNKWAEKVMPLYGTREAENNTWLENLYGKGRAQWLLKEGIDRAALVAGMFMPGAVVGEGFGLSRLVGAGVGEALDATGLAEKAGFGAADVNKSFQFLKRYTATAAGKSELGLNPVATKFVDGLKGVEQVLGGAIPQMAITAKPAEDAVRDYYTKGDGQFLHLSPEQIDEKAKAASDSAFWQAGLTAIPTAFIAAKQMYSSFNGAKNLFEKAVDSNLNPITLIAETGLEKFGKAVGKSLLTGLEGGLNETTQVAIGRTNELWGEGKLKDNGFKDFVKTYVDGWNEDPNMGNNMLLGTVQGILESAFHSFNHYRSIASGQQTSEHDKIKQLQNLIETANLNHSNVLTDYNVKEADGITPKIDKQTGKPILDKQKVINAIVGQIGQKSNFDDKMLGSTNNDHLIANWADHEAIAGLAHDFLDKQGGFEYVNDFIDAQKKKEEADPNRKNDNNLITGEEITPAEKAESLKKYVKELRKTYNSVNNQNISLPDALDIKSEDHENALNTLNTVKKVLYDTKARQLFVKTQIERNNNEITSLENSVWHDNNESIDRIKHLNNENKNLGDLHDELKEHYNMLTDKPILSKIVTSDIKKSKDTAKLLDMSSKLDNINYDNIEEVDNVRNENKDFINNSPIKNTIEKTFDEFKAGILTDKIKNIDNLEDLNDLNSKHIEPSSPKSKTKLDNNYKLNPETYQTLKQKVIDKKAELKAVKDAEEADTIANAKEDDNDFNGTSTTETHSTEGSDISDDLTPVTGENETPGDLEEAKKINPTEGKGVKLISYDRVKNKVLDWIEKQFPKGLSFERNPVNKVGTEVSFEINENPGAVSDNVKEALKQFKAGNLKDVNLLIDYLPINIKLTEGAYLPIETRRVNGEMNPETEMLRRSIIANLITGVPIESMNSTITGQYKGVLQVESPTAENSLLNLAGVTDLKYIKENTYFVNIHGQLENVLTGKFENFQNKFTKVNDRTKAYAAGEIYLMIPQADGISQFPLKLNISKLSIEESEGLFEIYKEILTQDKGSNTTLSEISPELLSIIQNIFGEQLKVITTPAKQKDIKLGEIIDLLVYESDKVKSRINVTEGILYFGDKSAHSGEIDALKEEIMHFLHTQKRHQIKIRPKSAEDNQRTNLSSNSANYIKYLVESKILSTNAVINQPAFQGYTNLFISPTVTTKGSEKVNKKSKPTKSITEIEDRLKGVRTIDELYQGFKSLNNKDQDLYKPLFTEKKLEIENKGKVKVSDAGVEIANNNFEGLDFGDNKKVDNKSKIADIKKRRQEAVDEFKKISNKELIQKFINEKHYHSGKVGESGNINTGIEQTDLLLNSKNPKANITISFKYIYNDKNNIEIKDDVLNEFQEYLKKYFNAKYTFSKGFSKTDTNSFIKFNFETNEELPSFKSYEIIDNFENIINAKYNAELKALENKSNNTRNIENNSVSLPESTTVIEDLSDSNKFVSSSDIPNTVENKQQMDKQNQVFKEPKGLEGQKDTKTITMLKDKVEKGTATEANLKQLESLKDKYGEEYVKKCK